MTTLAIIGSGIAGRSLLYNLSKTPHKFDKITLFSADHFTSPCTLNSTAVIARRGVTKGLSPLGDLLWDAFHEFKTHVEEDHPEGVYPISQISGATEKLESFTKRFPLAKKEKLFLKTPCDVFVEDAFLVDPKIYSDWLLSQAISKFGDRLHLVNELVTDVEDQETVKLKTNLKNEFVSSKVVFATGSYQRLWKNMVPGSALETSKPAHGAYLEFNNVELSQPSFSLTFNGMNLIWNKSLKRLLVGSTTSDVQHMLPDLPELKSIYDSLQKAVELSLPPFQNGEVKVGLREKAKKREPYLFRENNCIFVGGLYKNGYSLSIGMTKSLSRQFL